MNPTQGRYLMVLAVPAHPSGSDHFEIESAFAQHLRGLRARLGSLANELVLMGPAMDDAMRRVTPLATVHASEGIRFRALFSNDIGLLQLLRRWPQVHASIAEEVERADIVHAGPSTIYRPHEFTAAWLGHRRGKKTIYVMDIDHRQSARMRYQTGRSSWREYMTSRLLHDPLLDWQHRFAARHFSLVMLKGRKLARDYGKGRNNVKNFLDAAFDSQHVIAPESLLRKRVTALDRSQPLRLIYFGRLVDYKGVDHMLRALRHALDRGARATLEIVGDGDQHIALRSLASELKLDATVAFVGSLPFGPALFARLYDAQVLLAAPLTEDTPRSALDAVASGQVLIAYDTYYYDDLAQAGAPVDLVPWRDAHAMGDAIVALDADRERLATSMHRAREFALPNTQQAWLDRRIAWTRALFE